MKTEIRYKLTGLFLTVGILFCFSVPVAAKPKGSDTKPQGAAEKPGKPKQPDLQFKQKTFNFGSVYKGAVVEHKFEFTNKGDDVLKIDKVKTSCGCTTAPISSKIIKPGESGTIDATFRSKKFRGRITKSITVHSNDPDEGRIQLVIKGNVVDKVALDPPRLNFNMVPGGKAQSKFFHVRQLGKETLKILDIKSDKKFLSAKVVSEDKIFDPRAKTEKLDYEVEVKVADNAPSGRFNGTLTIKTNIQQQMKIKYQVAGIVR